MDISRATAAFLEQAALRYSVEVPTLTAQLMTQRQDPWLEKCKRPKHGLERCRGCQVLLLSGQTATVRIISNKTRKECKLCFRYHEEPIEPLKRATGNARDAEKSQPHEEQAKRTVNAGSKQRAKARKGGLQAMLAQSRQAAGGQPSFDLMDFMKR